MTLKSFEELEFLLNDEERKAFRKWKRRKAVLSQRPNYMTTQQRIMPYLPKWMKKKVIDARELFDCCNTCFGVDAYSAASKGVSHDIKMLIVLIVQFVDFYTVHKVFRGCQIMIIRMQR